MNNTKAHILIVEDDDEIAEFLENGLTVEGYRVDVLHEGSELLDKISRGRPDVVILDRRLPDADGVQLCQKMREAGHSTMVLMLTAKDAMDDKIEGLKAGADDYVTKPFAFGELLARLEALVRRTDAGELSSDLVIDDLRLDYSLKAAYRAERSLALTATEFSLLRFLAENAGKVMSRTKILSAVWGYDFDPNTNIVEVYINYLRKKVDFNQPVKMIVNVRGFGYMCKPPTD